MSADRGDGVDQAPLWQADAEGYLGLEVCRGCHRLETEHWEYTVHVAAFLEQPRTALEPRSLELVRGLLLSLSLLLDPRSPVNQ